MTVLYYLFYLVDSLIYAFQMILLVYCVCSWVIRDPFNKFMNILKSIIEPVLAPIRDVLYKIPAMRTLPIDLSVMIAYFLCSVIRSII